MGQAASEDWRDAAVYSYLAKAERSAFAWEWLRRIPAYREAALRRLGSGGMTAAEAASSDWGLHAFEDPTLNALEARPLWRADCHRFVLRAHATPGQASEETFALHRFRELATWLRVGLDEHLLLSDGCRNLRLDVSGASLLSGPVCLEYRIEGLASAEAPLLVLRRFLALAATGRFSRALHPPERRAGRLVLLLRASDALACGATQRELAIALLAGAGAGQRWRVETPSLRSRAQRLVRAARQYSGGAWRGLL